MSEPVDFRNLIVYSDGEFRRYDDARVGLLTHGLQYGTGCFEGIRGYWNEAEQDVLLFQLRAHYERLTRSCQTLLMDIGHSVDELIEISAELCARNGLRGHTYLRAIVFKNLETIGVRLRGIPETTAIIAVPHVNYYDASGGLRVGVSSWRRVDDTAAPVRAKVTGLYVNAALAKSEAEMNGFDEAIMLSQDGHISECSAENLFLVARRRALHARRLAEHPRGRDPQVHHDPGPRGAGADGGRAHASTAASSTAPTSCSSPAPRSGSTSPTRSTTARSATARWARSPASCRRSTTTRCTAGCRSTAPG